MAAYHSLTRRSVLEQLSNMARELAYASGRISKALMGGDIEGAYKVAREAKEGVDTVYYRLLDYIAGGRIELLDNADLYLFVARSLHRASQRLEAAVFRLTILGGDVGEDALRRAALLLVKAKEAASNLDSAITMLASASPESRGLVKSRMGYVARLEDEADSEYRSLISWLVDSSGIPPARMIILKDAADFIESVVDDIFEAANHLRIIAESV